MIAALKRLKCAIVGHAIDGDSPIAWAHPGRKWCARCQRFVMAKGPIPSRHLHTLRANGWTRDDLESVGHQYLPAAELLRFMRTIYDLREELPEKAATRGYIEGFQAGYVKCQVDGFPGDKIA